MRYDFITEGGKTVTQETFEQGYDIDHAYTMADRYAIGSDNWHRWMDEACRLERLHRGK